MRPPLALALVLALSAAQLASGDAAPPSEGATCAAPQGGTCAFLCLPGSLVGVEAFASSGNASAAATCGGAYVACEARGLCGSAGVAALRSGLGTCAASESGPAVCRAGAPTLRPSMPGALALVALPESAGACETLFAGEPCDFLCGPGDVLHVRAWGVDGLSAGEATCGGVRAACAKGAPAVVCLEASPRAARAHATGVCAPSPRAYATCWVTRG